MNVLGLSSNYHDASAALVVDGKLVAASTEERFSLIKHDPSFPLQASLFCLEQAGLNFNQLDFVAYHEDPNIKFTRTLASSFARFPRSRLSFVRTMQEALASGLKIKKDVGLKLGISNEKIIYTPHHMSHAAHAFYTSPFQDAAILTIDAVGEWTCTGVFQGHGQQIDPLDGVFFPHSLGLIYSAFTAFLGFKANDGECSTMALAAFGQPKYADSVRKIIQVQSDGHYKIDMSYFDFGNWNSLPITDKFVKLFGLPRPYKENLFFSCFAEAKNPTDPKDNKHQQRYADVAASVQLVLEEAILALAQRAKDLTSSPNLCLAGGVALNAVANSVLIKSNIFENVFVPIDPGDGGGATGSALYLASRYDSLEKSESTTPYIGKSYDQTSTLEIARHLDLTTVKKFSKPQDNYTLEIESHLNESEINQVIANDLKNEKIVGWFQGRFENGPRALGNRSILSSANSISTAKRLSTKVKKRAFFRPYALTMTDQTAKTLIEPQMLKTTLSRWMQTSARVNGGETHLVGAALHVDQTTRPQICHPKDNPRLYSLLNEISRQSGHGVVLNTSFNESGFPLVSSPNEALMMFLRTDMDSLVLNNSLLRKKR